MDRSRRIVVKAAAAAGFFAACGTALLNPGRALAAWSQGAFEAKSAAEAMKTLGIANLKETGDIEIRAPEIAENGAVVPIDITSNIPGTTGIWVFIEKNPFPYAGSFDFSQGALAYVHLRAKLGESTPVRVVAAAGGKFYTAAKEVKVTIGGCGG